MVSKALFKQAVKSNYLVVLIFMAVLTMYMSIMVSMYDPKTNDKMLELMASLPPQMMSAFGFKATDSTLIGFLASYFYGFLILIFPMIFEIIISNRLIAKQVDKGSMAYLLATPNTRKKIILTYGLFIFLAITILIVFTTIIGIAFSETMFSGMLDKKEFVMLNIGALLLHYTISGICFFSSCVSNDTKYSMSFGAGVPIAFFLIQMLANMGGKLESLKFATIFSLFNPTNIISGDISVIPSFIALGVIALALYLAGILVFNKKDLFL